MTGSSPKLPLEDKEGCGHAGRRAWGPRLPSCTRTSVGHTGGASVAIAETCSGFAVRSWLFLVTEQLLGCESSHSDSHGCFHVAPRFLLLRRPAQPWLPLEGAPARPLGELRPFVHVQCRFQNIKSSNESGALKAWHRF